MWSRQCQAAGSKSAVSSPKDGEEGAPLCAARRAPGLLSSPLPGESAHCNMSPRRPAPEASFQLQAAIRFSFLDHPHSPGDEFPHYLRDLHIGHVPHRPECPGRVWTVAAGSSLSAMYGGSEGQDRPLALAFVLFLRRARIGQDLQTMAASSKKPSQSWWQADIQGVGTRPTQPGRATGRRARPGSCPGQALLPTTCGQTSLAHSVRQGIRPGTGSATEGVQWHSRLSISRRVDWLSTAGREPAWPHRTPRVLFASPG